MKLHIQPKHYIIKFNYLAKILIQFQKNVKVELD